MTRDEFKNYIIKILDFNEDICYDGSQINPLYTYEYHKIPGNSVLIFKGKMKLTPNEMIDLKDIINESHLADVLISSDDALHFIIEEFDIQPPNLEIMYYRLRVLVSIVIELLQKKGVNSIVRKGTDIYINEKKLNVGIATIGGNSGKIHFGINIVSTGVPKHVQAIGLKDIGIKDKDIEPFATTIARKYIEEINKVKQDIVKTKTLK